ncbi:shikimate kinase [Wukongibacter baidiensis]|uniref:shikimate kinase n=1 Tax=Wukongibacter baidiensis TaxID=1723361 RepID=UPI003D7FD8DA
MQNNNKNIVLIGMPGCGKTTIGKLLSQRLNMKFCDVDHYIEEKEGRSIPDVFKDDGEAYFRKLETSAVEEVSEHKDYVISSGGGVVKFPRNMEALGKNGIIIFINRSVEEIISDVETEGRPLLKDGKEKLYKLYEERIELYKKYCDYEVRNDDSMNDVINRLLESLEL